MSETATQENPVAGDPLAAAASAMRHAADAIGDGASQPTAKAKQSATATKGFISRMAYSGSYYLAYGIVFPSLFVTNALPGCSSIANGLTDGANAAKDAATGAKK
jgi:hypothetical protein